MQRQVKGNHSPVLAERWMIHQVMELARIRPRGVQKQQIAAAAGLLELHPVGRAQDIEVDVASDDRFDAVPHRSGDIDSWEVVHA